MERVQRRWTKFIDGLLECSYAERLRRLEIFSVKGRLIRNDLILVYKILHGLVPSLENLLVLNRAGSTRGHSLKLFVPYRHSDTRSRFFTVRVVQRWNSLPDAVVSAPSVNSFKRQLGPALGELLYEFD